MLGFTTPFWAARKRVQLNQRLRIVSMCDSKLPPVAQRRIVSMGSVCIDQVATVASYPQPDTKIRSTEFEEYCGGNAANAAVATRRLGVETYLISAVGEDTRGEAVIDALSTAGVNVSALQRVYRARTPFTYVLVDASAGTRTCIHTPARRLAVPFIPKIHQPLIESANVLILDGRHSDTARQCAQVAQNANVPVLLDAERVREGTEQLLSMATGVVVKDALAVALAPNCGDGECAALAKLLERGPRWIVATRGKDGCVLVKPVDNSHFVDGEQFVEYGLKLHRRVIGDGSVEAVYCSSVDGIQVTDSTGAGDAFFGTLAYGILCNLELYKCIALANVVAALSCEGRGAQSSPSREYLESFLAKQESSVRSV